MMDEVFKCAYACNIYDSVNIATSAVMRHTFCGLLAISVEPGASLHGTRKTLLQAAGHHSFGLEDSSVETVMWERVMKNAILPT